MPAYFNVAYMRANNLREFSCIDFLPKLIRPISPDFLLQLRRLVRPILGQMLIFAFFSTITGNRAAKRQKSGRDGKQAEKIVGSLLRQLRQRYLLQIGQKFSDMAHIAGLVAFAPERHRRKIRRIGFDQHAF